MLNNLVNSIGCSTTDNESVTSAKDRNGIFTDVAEPDVGQRARAQAVDALERIGTNDNVGDGGTVLQDEDGILAASVVVRVTLVATVKLFVAEVDGTCDDASFWQRNDIADTSGNVQNVRSGHVGDEREKSDLRDHVEKKVASCQSNRPREKVRWIRGIGICFPIRHKIRSEK